MFKASFKTIFFWVAKEVFVVRNNCFEVALVAMQYLGPVVHGCLGEVVWSYKGCGMLGFLVDGV